MSGPGIAAWAAWLQRYIGAAVFPVDHPGLAECAGWHKPEWPCDGKRGKHPACKWSRDSTSDTVAIRRALTRDLRNYGIDTLKSGLLVVDEDRLHAFTEHAASISLVIPETFTVTTAQGRHFYFRQPPGEPLGNGTGTLPDGIDIRGRGYVVGPGSVHETGVIYMPGDLATPIAPIPEWLVTVLRSPAPGTRFQQPGGCHLYALPPPVGSAECWLSSSTPGGPALAGSLPATGTTGSTGPAAGQPR
jgi:hypothetical protein